MFYACSYSIASTIAVCIEKYALRGIILEKLSIPQVQYRVTYIVIERLSHINLKFYFRTISRTLIRFPMFNL